MRPGILPEHGFKHKGNHYASLPWFGTKIAQKYAIKGSKFSGFRRDVKPHVLTFSTSGNLVPRAHVPFGQHQDTELWNNQLARSQSPRVFLLNFDTTVLSKPDFDFPSFSSAY